MSARNASWLLVTTALAGIGSAALTAALPAAAQEAAQEVGGLEEVVVTAQRKVENLQSVPVSVMAIGAEQLERSAVYTVEGLNTLVPNAVIEHVGIFPNAASLSMRGVGYGGIESFTDPDVAVYVNGVYQARNATALGSTIDVSSIEVLRGPQGTLYGRNAFAGVVSLTTNRPVMNAFEGQAGLTYGNYGRVDIDLIGNVPLVQDKAALRIAARSHNLDGYYKNNGIVDAAGTVDQTLKGKSVGKEQNFYIRPSLRLTPTDNLDINILSEVYRDRSKPGPSQHLILPGSTLGTLGFPGFNPYGDERLGIPGDGSDPYSIGYSLENRPSDIDQYSVTGDIAYKTDIGTFRALLNLSGATEEIWTDTDGENINAFTSARWQDYKVYSGELQYISSFSKSLDLTAGIFALHDEYKTTQLSFTNFTATPPAVFTPFQNPSYINNEGKRTALAAYAQFEYHFNDQLSAVLGGRYSWEKKYGSRGENTTLAAAGLPPTMDFGSHAFSTVPGVVFGPIGHRWDNFAPRAGVNYKLNEDVLLFAFWQRAYKSGGFNANSSDLFAFLTPYGEERVDNFEGGIKSEWLNNRLRVNVNAFYSKFRGLQRSLVTQSPTAASGVTTVTTNAADLKSYGIELETAAKVMDQLTVFANLGWNKASYTDYCAALAGLQTTTTPAVGSAACGPITTFSTAAGPRFLVPADYSSLRPIRAPRWDITAGFTKDFSVADAGTVSLTSSLNYRSSAYVNLLNVPYSFRPSMVTIDASLRWEPVDGRYSVTVWGRNLTKEVEILNYLPVGTLFASANPTAPRTYGVSLNVKF